MKKILLLGANGQLGTDIQYIFSFYPQYELINVFRKDLDLEKDDIYQFLKQIDFDVLINCTSYHKTDECEDFPLKSFIVNGIAVREMAKFCNLHNKLFIHFTTDFVFDGEKNQPYVENDCTNPLNVYGVSKLTGEQFIKSYHDKFFIFRVSSLFGLAGPSGKGNNFVETMIQLGKQGKKLTVVDDQVMSPTHTLEIAITIVKFIEENIEEYGVYHCSGEGECSWYEFAAEIFEQLYMNVNVTPVPHTAFPTKAKRPSYSVLDNTKINNIYQMKSWRNSLTDYLVRKGHL
ncbi:dTDP-4-dehydrorhamnose reductase [Bacillus sp. JJ1562]|uniref:dTDP-4-dehydrorhamnose reductase n=1 Tax=Bacillus sp. JJ1562 TaxID=3122960 RepID=UPI0030017C43